MRKRKSKTKKQIPVQRNPFVSIVKKMKPRIVKSKKIYTRTKTAWKKLHNNIAQGGRLNDFLHSSRRSFSYRNTVHAFQTGYKKSAGIRRVCRHWSKPSSYNNVRWHIRRNDGRSNSRSYYINRSVLHEKANGLQEAAKKWFSLAMGKRTTKKRVQPCNISIKPNQFKL